MSDDDGGPASMHGTRRVREEEDGTAVISLPEAALEASGLAVGDEAMIGTVDGEDTVVLIPWDEEALLEELGPE